MTNSPNCKLKIGAFLSNVNHISVNLMSENKTKTKSYCVERRMEAQGLARVLWIIWTMKVYIIEMENKPDLGYILKANCKWYLDNLYVYIWEWGFWWIKRNNENPWKSGLNWMDLVIQKS